MDLGRFSQQVLSFWLAASFNRLGEAACLCCEAESSAEFLFSDGVFSSSLLSQHLLLWLRAQLRVISVCPPKHLRHCLVTVEYLKWIWSRTVGGSLLSSEWVQALVIHLIPRIVGPAAHCLPKIVFHLLSKCCPVAELWCGLSLAFYLLLILQSQWEGPAEIRVQLSWVFVLAC